ncbi:hypothetical protein GV828_02195 [Flavobacterium sp. NST-5]|uniref:Lipoprotein n=1 Tax=Flavobacterium ichthyis TaxID=2698827 RepID=A0ABW9Z5N1_9FLAO|nr:hypothetical protein [Flavobacterium ichthyis]NBL64006.1 hypothetical protein [Flavobacterium ichthyis]
MKKQLTFIALLLLMIISCNDKKENTPENQNIPEKKNKIAAKECYHYAKNKDSISLTLIYGENQKISGDLVYNFYQKDGNFGSFDGIIKGDTLILNYHFESEGIKSLREEIFLKKGLNLLRGYGEMAILNGKEFVKERKNIKFDNDFALLKIDCNE